MGAACKLSWGEAMLVHTALPPQATTRGIFPDVCAVLKFPNLFTHAWSWLSSSKKILGAAGPPV